MLRADVAAGSDPDAAAAEPVPALLRSLELPPARGSSFVRDGRRPRCDSDPGARGEALAGVPRSAPASPEVAGLDPADPADPSGRSFLSGISLHTAADELAFSASTRPLASADTCSDDRTAPPLRRRPCAGGVVCFPRLLPLAMPEVPAMTLAPDAATLLLAERRWPLLVLRVLLSPPRASPSLPLRTVRLRLKEPLEERRCPGRVGLVVPLPDDAAAKPRDDDDALREKLRPVDDSRPCWMIDDVPDCRIRERLRERFTLDDEEPGELEPSPSGRAGRYGDFLLPAAEEPADRPLP